jgi:hypothetical protein
MIHHLANEEDTESTGALFFDRFAHLRRGMIERVERLTVVRDSHPDGIVLQAEVNRNLVFSAIFVTVVYNVGDDFLNGELDLKDDFLRQSVLVADFENPIV